MTTDSSAEPTSEQLRHAEAVLRGLHVPMKYAQRFASAHIARGEDVPHTAAEFVQAIEEAP